MVMAVMAVVAMVVVAVIRALVLTPARIARRVRRPQMIAPQALPHVEIVRPERLQSGTARPERLRRLVARPAAVYSRLHGWFCLPLTAIRSTRAVCLFQ